MKYHGNYCGPGWSAGKAQDSVISDLPGIDEFDETCREHDKAYYLNRIGASNGLRGADLSFAKKNLASGNPKRMIAGLLVGAQGLLRSADKEPPKLIKSKKKTLRMVSNQNARPKMSDANYNALRSSIIRTNLRQTKPKPKPSKLKTRDTHVNLPSSYMLNASLQKPLMTNVGGITVLKHRGLMRTVIGSTTFNCINEQVNPGKASIFPWMSRLARSYDKYRFKKLKFIYRPVCATTQTGVVMMSFDFDTLDSIPVTKAQQSQTLPNVESNAFAPCELKVDCDKVWRFTRQGGIAAGDLKTYDLGQIVISSAYATATLLGEVYVEYEVELEKPTAGVPLQCRIEALACSRAAPFTGAVNSSTATPFTVLNSSQLICTTPGEYYITVQYIGTVITNAIEPTITTVVPGGVVGNVLGVVITAAALTAIVAHKVRCSSGDILEFSNRTTATTITGLLMHITECEYSTI